MRGLPVRMTGDYHGTNRPKRSPTRNVVLFVMAFAATFGAAWLVLNLLV